MRAADVAPAWFKLFSATAMLLIVGFPAVLAAGLVNYLLDPRLTGSGASRGAAARPCRRGRPGRGRAAAVRVPPRAGVPVVAVERDDEAPTLRRAKEKRIPVVIGGGASEDLLEGLSLGRRERSLR